MKRIPTWKIRRELSRVRQQLAAFPEAIWEPRLQKRHDCSIMSGEYPVRTGRQSETDKIAIVLIWQPGGISASTFRLLRHLTSRDYAPFVISNAPISKTDSISLSEQVWKWMQRPNFGYDFGGYRDALRVMRSWRADPAQLVIMNDSLWFPLTDDDETLEGMAALNADVVGSILRTRNDTKFLESYLFSISNAAYNHPDFSAFWDQFRITSNKYKVIRRGERGFSQAMLAAGMVIQPMFTRRAFEQALASMSVSELQSAVRYCAVLDERLEARRLHLSERAAVSGLRDDCITYISDVLVKGQFYSSFPVVSAGRMRYPFMKKSREPISARWRQMYSNAVQDGVLAPPASEVWNEIQTTIDG